jgi:hypothetical protein
MKVKRILIWQVAVVFGILTAGLQVLRAQEQYPVPVRENNEPVAPGKFKASWESLKQYEVPEWFRNAKFGIWAHWGPQCQPGQGDWYARIRFTAKDIRFNVNKDILYVTLMGSPDENVLIRSLGTAAAPEKIKKIEMLGSKEKVKWRQGADAVEITKPAAVPSDIAVVYKIYR